MAYVYASRFGADVPTGCRELCYDAKSVEYSICRAIPVLEKKLRTACFENADKNLSDCLGTCPAPKISGATVVAATAVAAVLLLR